MSVRVISRRYTVIKVADEFVVNLMKSAGGITYADATTVGQTFLSVHMAQRQDRPAKTAAGSHSCLSVCHDGRTDIPVCPHGTTVGQTRQNSGGEPFLSARMAQRHTDIKSHYVGLFRATCENTQRKK
jgi:hypothetical protein